MENSFNSYEDKKVNIYESPIKKFFQTPVQVYTLDNIREISKSELSFIENVDETERKSKKFMNLIRDDLISDLKHCIEVYKGTSKYPEKFPKTRWLYKLLMQYIALECEAPPTSMEKILFVLGHVLNVPTDCFIHRSDENIIYAILIAASQEFPITKSVCNEFMSKNFNEELCNGKPIFIGLLWKTKLYTKHIDDYGTDDEDSLDENPYINGGMVNNKIYGRRTDLEIKSETSIESNLMDEDDSLPPLTKQNHSSLYFFFQGLKFVNKDAKQVKRKNFKEKNLFPTKNMDICSDDTIQLSFKNSLVLSQENCINMKKVEETNSSQEKEKNIQTTSKREESEKKIQSPIITANSEIAVEIDIVADEKSVHKPNETIVVSATNNDITLESEKIDLPLNQTDEDTIISKDTSEVPSTTLDQKDEVTIISKDTLEVPSTTLDQKDEVTIISKDTLEVPSTTLDQNDEVTIISKDTLEVPSTTLDQNEIQNKCDIGDDTNNEISELQKALPQIETSNKPEMCPIMKPLIEHGNVQKSDIGLFNSLNSNVEKSGSMLDSSGASNTKEETLNEPKVKTCANDMEINLPLLNSIDSNNSKGHEIICDSPKCLQKLTSEILSDNELITRLEEETADCTKLEENIEIQEKLCPRPKDFKEKIDMIEVNVPITPGSPLEKENNPTVDSKKKEENKSHLKSKPVKETKKSPKATSIPSKVSNDDKKEEKKSDLKSKPVKEAKKSPKDTSIPSKVSNDDKKEENHSDLMSKPVKEAKKSPTDTCIPSKVSIDDKKSKPVEPEKHYTPEVAAKTSKEESCKNEIKKLEPAIGLEDQLLDNEKSLSSKAETQNKSKINSCFSTEINVGVSLNLRDNNKDTFKANDLNLSTIIEIKDIKAIEIEKPTTKQQKELINQPDTNVIINAVNNIEASSQPTNKEREITPSIKSSEPIVELKEKMDVNLEEVSFVICKESITENVLPLQLNKLNTEKNNLKPSCNLDKMTESKTKSIVTSKALVEAESVNVEPDLKSEELTAPIENSGGVDTTQIKAPIKEIINKLNFEIQPILNDKKSKLSENVNTSSFEIQAISEILNDKESKLSENVSSKSDSVQLSSLNPMKTCEVKTDANLNLTEKVVTPIVEPKQVEICSKLKNEPRNFKSAQKITIETSSKFKENEILKDTNSPINTQLITEIEPQKQVINQQEKEETTSPCSKSKAMKFNSDLKAEKEKKTEAPKKSKPVRTNKLSLSNDAPDVLNTSTKNDSIKTVEIVNEVNESKTEFLEGSETNLENSEVAKNEIETQRSINPELSVSNECNKASEVLETENNLELKVSTKKDLKELRTEIITPSQVLAEVKICSNKGIYKEKSTLNPVKEISTKIELDNKPKSVVLSESTKEQNNKIDSKLILPVSNDKSAKTTNRNVETKQKVKTVEEGLDKVKSLNQCLIQESKETLDISSVNSDQESKPQTKLHEEKSPQLTSKSNLELCVPPKRNKERKSKSNDNPKNLTKSPNEVLTQFLESDKVKTLGHTNTKIQKESKGNVDIKSSKNVTRTDGQLGTHTNKVKSDNVSSKLKLCSSFTIEKVPKPDTTPKSSTVIDENSTSQTVEAAKLKSQYLPPLINVSNKEEKKILENENPTILSKNVPVKEKLHKNTNIPNDDNELKKKVDSHEQILTRLGKEKLSKLSSPKPKKQSKTETKSNEKSITINSKLPKIAVPTVINVEETKISNVSSKSYPLVSPEIETAKKPAAKLKNENITIQDILSSSIGIEKTGTNSSPLNIEKTSTSVNEIETGKKNISSVQTKDKTELQKLQQKLAEKTNEDKLNLSTEKGKGSQINYEISKQKKCKTEDTQTKEVKTTTLRNVLKRNDGKSDNLLDGFKSKELIKKNSVISDNLEKSVNNEKNELPKQNTNNREEEKKKLTVTNSKKGKDVKFHRNDKQSIPKTLIEDSISTNNLEINTVEENESNEINMVGKTKFTNQYIKCNLNKVHNNTCFISNIEKVNDCNIMDLSINKQKIEDPEIIQECNTEIDDSNLLLLSRVAEQEATGFNKTNKNVEIVASEKRSRVRMGCKNKNPDVHVINERVINNIPKKPTNHLIDSILSKGTETKTVFAEVDSKKVSRSKSCDEEKSIELKISERRLSVDNKNPKASPLVTDLKCESIENSDKHKPSKKRVSFSDSSNIIPNKDTPKKRWTESSNRESHGICSTSGQSLNLNVPYPKSNLSTRRETKTIEGVVSKCIKMNMNNEIRKSMETVSTNLLSTNESESFTETQTNKHLKELEVRSEKEEESKFVGKRKRRESEDEVNQLKKVVVQTNKLDLKYLLNKNVNPHGQHLENNLSGSSTKTISVDLNSVLPSRFMISDESNVKNVTVTENTHNSGPPDILNILNEYTNEVVAAIKDDSLENMKSANSNDSSETNNLDFGDNILQNQDHNKTIKERKLSISYESRTDCMDNNIEMNIGNINVDKYELSGCLETNAAEPGNDEEKRNLCALSNNINNLEKILDAFELNDTVVHKKNIEISNEIVKSRTEDNDHPKVKVENVPQFQFLSHQSFSDENDFGGPVLNQPIKSKEQDKDDNKTNVNLLVDDIFPSAEDGTNEFQDGTNEFQGGTNEYLFEHDNFFGVTNLLVSDNTESKKHNEDLSCLETINESRGKQMPNFPKQYITDQKFGDFFHNLSIIEQSSSKDSNGNLSANDGHNDNELYFFDPDCNEVTLPNSDVDSILLDYLPTEEDSVSYNNKTTPNKSNYPTNENSSFDSFKTTSHDDNDLEGIMKLTNDFGFDKPQEKDLQESDIPTLALTQEQIHDERVKHNSPNVVRNVSNPLSDYVENKKINESITIINEVKTPEHQNNKITENRPVIKPPSLIKTQDTKLKTPQKESMNFLRTGQKTKVRPPVKKLQTDTNTKLPQSSSEVQTHVSNQVNLNNTKEVTYAETQNQSIKDGEKLQRLDLPILNVIPSENKSSPIQEEKCGTRKSHKESNDDIFDRLKKSTMTEVPPSTNRNLPVLSSTVKGDAKRGNKRPYKEENILENDQFLKQLNAEVKPKKQKTELKEKQKIELRSNIVLDKTNITNPVGAAKEKKDIKKPSKYKNYTPEDDQIKKSHGSSNIHDGNNVYDEKSTFSKNLSNRGSTKVTASYIKQDDPQTISSRKRSNRSTVIDEKRIEQSPSRKSKYEKSSSSPMSVNLQTSINNTVPKKEFDSHCESKRNMKSSSSKSDRDYVTTGKKQKNYTREDTPVHKGHKSKKSEAFEPSKGKDVKQTSSNYRCRLDSPLADEKTEVLNSQKSNRVTRSSKTQESYTIQQHDVYTVYDITSEGRLPIQQRQTRRSSRQNSYIEDSTNNCNGYLFDRPPVRKKPMPMTQEQLNELFDEVKRDDRKPSKNETNFLSDNYSKSGQSKKPVVIDPEEVSQNFLRQQSGCALNKKVCAVQPIRRQTNPPPEAKPGRMQPHLSRDHLPEERRIPNPSERTSNHNIPNVRQTREISKNSRGEEIPYNNHPQQQQPVYLSFHSIPERFRKEFLKFGKRNVPT